MSHSTTDEDSDGGLQTPTPTQPTQISSPSTRQQVMSPEPLSSSLRPKKPGLGRKPSKLPAPQKGQEFSADDDAEEYESDYAHVQRRATSRTASGLGLRRQTSTLRRRPTAHAPSLPRVESQDEDDEELRGRTPTTPAPPMEQDPPTVADEAQDDVSASGEDDGDDEDQDQDQDQDDSDAESFTLRDKQTAINQTHPFGIRIWKPALYQKNRSIEKTAEGDIHSSPGGQVSRWLWIFNALWTLLFGWWLALITAIGGCICLALGLLPEATEYGHVFLGLARYLLYPFGRFVRLEQDEAYAEEDEGEGRSITEYEQWQSGDLEGGRLFFGPLTSRSLVGRRRASMDSTDENDSLLGRTQRGYGDDGNRNKRRLFGRGQWTFGRVLFFVFFYCLIAPLLLLISGICWFLVFWIPMGKVTMLLFRHLRRHPLALSFHSDSSWSRRPSSSSSSVLVCTYRAVGSKYWKYTIDGTNIFLINLIGVVLFAIFDYWILGEVLGLDTWLVSPGFVFALALFSIIPLAYFIGQAVASISAQSSMGVGAAINAFFSTIVEVFLYCVALKQGKGQLVEGSIIGSIFAGILFLPGLSMCFGALKRKTQRFNVKSAGVTSTMLLFAVIAAFGPTLFYQIYGSHELNCHSCIIKDAADGDCRRCYFSQVPAVHDRFFLEAVRPYCWFSAVLLFLSYTIGLWFTLRTHAAVIWNTELEEKEKEKKVQTPHANGSINMHSVHPTSGRPPKQHGGSSVASTVRNQNQIRDSPLYKRILGQSLQQAGLDQPSPQHSHTATNAHQNSPQTSHVVPPKSSGADSKDTTHVDGGSIRSLQLAGLSEEENQTFVRQVAEIAATAAAVAAHDATTHTVSRKASTLTANRTPRQHPSNVNTAHVQETSDEPVVADAMGQTHAAGGHDAPNWSRLKSAVILLGATLLYAIIAEILVNTVDVVLESVAIDQKFLGITLFALVPNTTEFLNAISFAMNGNIALSMEIGSAYALQVCLLQIPALVLFSAFNGRFLDHEGLLDHTFK